MRKPVDELTPRFVEFIPKNLECGELYISMGYATTSHLCCCGCGEKVVLPLHPTDWRLCYDGESITIRPSVGNWGFPCRSHYLITANRVVWANEWSDEQIAEGRRVDAVHKAAWDKQSPKAPSNGQATGSKPPKAHGLLARLIRKLFNRH